MADQITTERLREIAKDTSVYFGATRYEGAAMARELLSRRASPHGEAGGRPSITEALRMMNCPRPCNHRPDEFTVGECVDAGECGCVAGNGLSAAARVAPEPVADEDEAYEIGKRDGYEEAIQDLDLATGGDGEFKGSTIPGETVDVPAMRSRIIERLASPSNAEPVADVFANLREANIARQAAWCPEQVPDLSFRGNELAGETGEVCNVIKKLERERLGWRGSRDTVEHLAEELADVVICADLCALSAGIDLNAAVVAKFNATSEKVGLPQRLASPSIADPTDWRAMFFWPDAKRRLWFISDCLARHGQVNRADICEAFGVSVPQASADLREWQRLHPGAVEYDKSAKTYRPSAIRALTGADSNA